jgi:Tfp pilus assembly protein PilO
MKAKLLNYLMISLVGVTVLMSGGVFYFFNQRLSETIGELSKREEDIDVANLEVDTLERLQKDLARLEEIKPEIDGALPHGKTQSQSVAQILDIARANGITFKTISFEATQGLPAENSQTQPSTVLPSVSSVPITLDADSVGYGALKGFLRDIFAIRRNANVSTLTLTRDDSKPGRVGVHLTIDIHLEKVAAPLTEA